MPKSKSLEYVKEFKRPAIAPVEDLLRGYQRDLHMSDIALGKAMGMTGNGVTQRKRKPQENIKLGELKQYTQALHIPPDEMADAIKKYLEK